MPARCEHCGEEALTDTARFCVGCGGALPVLEPHEVLAELERTEPPPVLHLPRTEPPPPPPPPAPAPRPDTPAFTPRSAPAREAMPTPPPVVKPQRPRMPPIQPLRDTSPAVPLSLVVAGVVGLLALLLILLLAA